MDECDDEYNKTTVAITDDPSGAEACFCMIFWSCPWRDPTEDDTEANRCVSFFLESSGDTRHVMYFNTDLKLHKKHKPTEWARNQHRFFPLLPPPPLGWVRALSKRSGAGYFLSTTSHQ